MRSWIVLGLLILLSSTASAIGQENEPFNPFGAEPRERDINKLPLAEKLESIVVDCQIIDLPLKELIEKWGNTYQVDFTISAEANEQKPTPSEIRSNVLLKGAHLSGALSVVLTRHDLAWHIDEQRVIITTRKFAKSRLTLQSYDLRKLDAKQVVQRLGDRLGKELETFDGQQRGYQLLVRENALRVRQTVEFQRQIAISIGRMQKEHRRIRPSFVDPRNDPFGGSLEADDPFGLPLQQ